MRRLHVSVTLFNDLIARSRFFVSDFEPKFKLLAESIQKQAHLKQDVFLGRLDFADGREVFSRVTCLLFRRLIQTSHRRRS